MHIHVEGFPVMTYDRHALDNVSSSLHLPQSGTCAIIVAHVRTVGINGEIKEFARKHYRRVLEINHPLEHSQPASSSWRVYEAGSVIAEGSATHSLPEYVRFCYDMLLTLKWSYMHARGASVIVGLGVLNGASGLIARMLRIAQCTCCWMIDYSPQRFPSKIGNRLFHLIEAIVAWRSDETWNVTDRILHHHKNARFWYLVRRRRNRQKVVPVGVGRMATLAEERENGRLVFVGHVLEKQGLQLVIGALPHIQQAYPEAHLVVIGDGPHLPSIREQVMMLDLHDSVRFTGLLPSEDSVWHELTTASIGMAPYLHAEDSFTYFGDPHKIKFYASAGLAICVTSVPAISARVQESGCGLVVDDNVASVAAGVLSLLRDPDMSQRRRAAVSFAVGFSWERIFSYAFENVLPPFQS